MFRKPGSSLASPARPAKLTSWRRTAPGQSREKNKAEKQGSSDVVWKSREALNESMTW